MDDCSKYHSKLSLDGSCLWTTTNGYLSFFSLKKPVKLKFAKNNTIVQRNTYVGLDPVCIYEIVDDFIVYAPAENRKQLCIVHPKLLWKKTLKT